MGARREAQCCTLLYLWHNLLTGDFTANAAWDIMGNRQNQGRKCNLVLPLKTTTFADDICSFFIPLGVLWIEKALSIIVTGTGIL